MKTNTRIKRAAIPRAGYEYQDLAGIEVLIRQYRDPDLYAWVQLEADETAYRSLDDVIALRKDGSCEYLQVKFTVDPNRYELDFDWLLTKTENGASSLEKWSRTLARVAAMGPIHSAGLKTNRPPSPEFSRCMNGTRVDLDLLPQEIRDSIEEACGGTAEANTFFGFFNFWAGQHDLDGYENYLHDQLVPMDTDSHGWLVLRHHVKRWATYKNQPEPDGRILREHVIQLITKRRPQPIRQDFVVPNGYCPPNEAFDNRIRERMADDSSPITVLWGTPGRGKSTYLSYLTHELQKEGAAVARHHYFLSSEDSSSNRTSFVEISTSLMDQLFVRHPGAMTDAPGDVDQLRSAIAIAAKNLATEGNRLYIVIDGLDHVWRDTQRVDQLMHLFNELLPLPPNVSLIVGTQRVSDDKLPGKLLSIAKDDDWVDIPRMDEVAVHQWVIQQDETRPLILRFEPEPDRRHELVEEIAKAFFKISRGHPLYLIYAYEELIRAGRPISSDRVEQLPPCPDGDIRAYYRGLWARLSASAKNALHMLAGSDFFWPSLGIRQVLGDFSEIDHLLEPRNVGMVPFHQSIFSWVRERPDHAECYRSLLPKIIHWLTNEAPEYWRWGWLWLVKAQSGDFEDLLEGTTRDWVVESLAKGWPDKQIENILAAAEARTFEAGDLPRTVFLRSLKTRVSNAREFQARDFATYRAAALSIYNNFQQTLNLLDDVHDLADSELAELARLGPKELTSQLLSAIRDELARRVNAWIALRHRPGHEFTKLSDHLLSVCALMNEDIVERALRYTRGFSDPEPHVAKLVLQLENARNIVGLQLVRRKLGSSKWRDQRRFVNDALIRACSFVGGDVRDSVSCDKEPLSLFATCWFLWRDRGANLEAYVPPIPDDVVRDRYSLGDNASLTEFFRDSFWTALYVSIRANGDYSMVHPGLTSGDAGWIPEGLERLEEIARRIVGAEIAPTFSAIYSGTSDIEPVRWGPAPERECAQYRAFREALLQIAIDLHFFGICDTANPVVSSSELRIVRQSAHWSDEIWVARNVASLTPILDSDGAAELLTDEARSLSTHVTEFSERSERWTHLAVLARLYGDGRQAEFLMHAAECLVGYGWRKDIGAIDVLDGIAELGAINPIVTRKRLDTVVPIIDVITDFTDGDETNHVRSELIEVVARVALERLPSLYEHHLSNDDHSYADECLMQFARAMDFDSREGIALARTFLDDRVLSVLEDRATNESSACTLLQSQNTFLGRHSRGRVDSTTTKRERSEREKVAAEVDPASFGCDGFAAVADAAADVHYEDRKEFMTKWLQHWSSQGRTSLALKSISSYFEGNETSYGADDILDEAFLVSLAVEGKDSAYPWLVKAHIHRNGWQSYYTSETEAMERIGLAARHYSDRWIQYIRDTSLPAPYYRRRRYSFTLGYKYLVRFLMLAGQTDLADRTVAAFVETLVDEVREQPIPVAPWFH